MKLLRVSLYEPTRRIERVRRPTNETRRRHCIPFTFAIMFTPIGSREVLPSRPPGLHPPRPPSAPSNGNATTIGREVEIIDGWRQSGKRFERKGEGCVAFGARGTPIPRRSYPPSSEIAHDEPRARRSNGSRLLRSNTRVSHRRSTRTRRQRVERSQSEAHNAAPSPTRDSRRRRAR